jgi:hypothetical protein
MKKPMITVPHVIDETGTEFRLYPKISKPFMKAMGYLYPAFASYDKAERGYSAFHNGKFVGCFGGLTLQSVRRNPLLVEDGSQLFMRALLGGLSIDGYAHHSSVCDPRNYGTLRLWKKLGLGAKLDGRGKARSAFADLEGASVLDMLIQAINRDEYDEHRVIASRRLAHLTPEDFIPTEDDFSSSCAGVCVNLNVILLDEQT